MAVFGRRMNDESEILGPLPGDLGLLNNIEWDTEWETGVLGWERGLPFRGSRTQWWAYHWWDEIRMLYEGARGDYLARRGRLIPSAGWTFFFSLLGGMEWRERRERQAEGRCSFMCIELLCTQIWWILESARSQLVRRLRLRRCLA